MKSSYLVPATLTLLSLSFGCSKPDRVAVIRSPTDGLFYTVETFRAIGLSSDTTRVYAHLENNGKNAKLLVLEGEDLTVTKIIWNNPLDATLCLDGGITGTFRNEVTLIAGNTPHDSKTVYNHLNEHCGVR